MLAHAIGELDAANTRHMHVDQCDIRLHAANQRKPLLAVRGLTHHFNTRLLREDHAKAGPNQLMVVDQDNTNHDAPKSVPRQLLRQ